MTKTEKAYVETLELGIKMAKALRWPEYNHPAPMTRAEIEAAKPSPDFSAVARGWFANPFGEGRVTYGCSSGSLHSTEGEKTNSQTMGVMYVTELDALKSIRLVLTERYAKHLAKLDERIAACADEGSEFSVNDELSPTDPASRDASILARSPRG